MQRAVIYARYSSDLQHDRSIEDQVALCRAYAEREGLNVAKVFADRAKTGATVFARDGLLDLVQRAKRHEFEVVIVESLDRLSRDQEDLAGLFKRFQFNRVEIRTVNEGTATPIHVGLRGLMGQMFLADLAGKVKRGMSGRVREGKMVWKPPYGYRPMPAEPGRVEIDPAEAEIVRRIFAEYIAGLSPRIIAARLCEEEIPSPSGLPWTHATIIGGVYGGKRKGIIGNPTYLGQLRFGVYEHPLNPDTGRRSARPTDPQGHMMVPAPELRILDDTTWHAAQAIADGRAKAKNIHELKARGITPRNSRLLAGMVRCGVCGGSMIIGCQGRRGAGRFKCAAAHKGQCSHTKSYDIGRIERHVVGRICELFRNPAALAAFFEGVQQELNEDGAKARAELGTVEKRLREIEAQTLRLIHALENGRIAEHHIAPRLESLDLERTHLAERMRKAQAEASVLALHPRAIEAYRHAFDVLESCLQNASDMPADERMIFRTVLDHVIIHETAPRADYEVSIAGKLGAFLDAPALPKRRNGKDLLTEQGFSCSNNVTLGPPQVTQSQQPGQVISFGRWRERRAA